MARGDHLFFYRAGSAYSHHGIDCGDGHVIHYESSMWMKLAAQTDPQWRPRVRRTSCADFARGQPVFVRGYDRPDAVDLVLARARSRLGEAAYDLLENNCEHFAVWCKTGRAASSQVRAVEHADRVLAAGRPATRIVAQAARQLPPELRGMVVGGMVAVTGSVYVAAYLRARDQQIKAGLS